MIENDEIINKTVQMSQRLDAIREMMDSRKQPRDALSSSFEKDTKGCNGNFCRQLSFNKAKIATFDFFRRIFNECRKGKMTVNFFLNEWKKISHDKILTFW
jgi:hypothetical protein